MSIKSAISLTSISQKALRDARDLEHEIVVLRQQVGRLTLASIAMAEILRDHLGISNETVEAKILEIDLRDGKIDGTFNPAAENLQGLWPCQRTDEYRLPLLRHFASERIIPSWLLEPASDLNFRTPRSRTVE